ncbi:hypothetical protein CHLRE_05g242857v5 [Chlamydomonas reinhardtii]|uniref:phytol kinase n=1 Tax=Chlamydomonas reinhardtii TaxID=3055 RepID=A0A2K3DSD6_CHLRE|nr:uncharacterized protein CHLRE_05g242857v5 [Chlamydomonas reinhardtii]PNW83452.1 hypothetical protein CHLRE_05g242857v5 [Chlamydomonas reinhardtii]
MGAGSCLDGPSALVALVAPGRGKTCAPCKRITYCCGACQLRHWRGGHARQCAVLARAAVGALAVGALWRGLGRGLGLG